MSLADFTSGESSGPSWQGLWENGQPGEDWSPFFKGIVATLVPAPSWMSENRCASPTIRGRCSLILMFGEDVRMGRNSPWYSSGALAFMSHMSMRGASPWRRNRAVDLADLPPALEACAEGVDAPKGWRNPAALDAAGKD